MKTFLAVALAAAITVMPFRNGEAAPSGSDAAMLALCRAWNAVRFLDPNLQSETDERWDNALLAAIPVVERDPAALSTAVDAMLATLHDPITLRYPSPAAAATAMPSVEIADGVRTVRVNGYPADAAAYKKELQEALIPAASDRGIVVDLRTSHLGSFAQVGTLLAIWRNTPFAGSLTSVPIAIPPMATRYLLGFPTETGAFVSGVYREGRESWGTETFVKPSRETHQIPIAFVADKTAVVPTEALALANAGKAAIFSTDDTPGILDGDEDRIDAGDGLVIAMRTAAPLPMPAIRSGGLDAALAWLHAPAPATNAAADADQVPIKTRYANPALPDDPHRVLAAFRMWGTIAYLDPYKALIHDDWDAALVAGVRGVRAATTSLDYELALMKQYAHIHDSHGVISAPASARAFAAMPAFGVRQIEGRPTIVVVDKTIARRDGFAVGDVIEAVDGETIAARTARLRPYRVASTEQSMLLYLDTSSGRPSLFTGPAGSIVTLRLRGADGRVRVVRTPRELPRTGVYRFGRTGPVIDVLPEKIGYVDLARLEIAQIPAMLSKLAHTRAIVFDLRGYPRGTFYPLSSHLTAKPVRAAMIRTPLRTKALSLTPDPDESVTPIDQTRDFFQILLPAAPRLAQPVVVLIDVFAISQSEHTALFLRAAAHARFVGEPTAGANGDVTQFVLPGGITANFSGEAILHPDGAQLQRIGIIPDIHISPTLRGIRTGKDEVLEAGLKEAVRLAE